MAIMLFDAVFNDKNGMKMSRVSGISFYLGNVILSALGWQMLTRCQTVETAILDIFNSMSQPVAEMISRFLLFISFKKSKI